MLETEATALWCPFINRHCITGECMMWKQSSHSCSTENKKSKPSGEGWKGTKSCGSRWEWINYRAGYCKARESY